MSSSSSTLCHKENNLLHNGEKSRIQHSERSELRLQKLIKNAKNGPICRVFENLEIVVKQRYKTGQFGGNAKIEKFICDISGHFQTM